MVQTTAFAQHPVVTSLGCYMMHACGLLQPFVEKSRPHGPSSQGKIPLPTAPPILAPALLRPLLVLLLAAVDAVLRWWEVFKWALDPARADLLSLLQAIVSALPHLSVLQKSPTASTFLFSSRSLPSFLLSLGLAAASTLQGFSFCSSSSVSAWYQPPGSQSAL